MPSPPNEMTGICLAQVGVPRRLTKADGIEDIPGQGDSIRAPLERPPQDRPVDVLLPVDACAKSNIVCAAGAQLDQAGARSRVGSPQASIIMARAAVADKTGLALR